MPKVGAGGLLAEPAAPLDQAEDSMKRPNIGRAIRAAIAIVPVCVVFLLEALIDVVEDDRI